jgi:hypothetical protein
MVDAPEDETVVAKIPPDRCASHHGTPLILQVSPLDGSSDPDKFFYNAFADIKSSNFVVTRAFIIHHGHVVIYHDYPNATSFQDLYPLANIRYISLLP